jgi:hypothetical protein
LVGVAVKVTAEPAQLGFVPEVNAIETAGISVAFTVMTIPELVALVGLAQAELEVITQLTVWPLVSADVVNAGLFVPEGVAFTYH